MCKGDLRKSVPYVVQYIFVRESILLNCCCKLPQMLVCLHYLGREARQS